MKEKLRGELLLISCELLFLTKIHNANGKIPYRFFYIFLRKIQSSVTKFLYCIVLIWTGIFSFVILITTGSLSRQSAPIPSSRSTPVRTSALRWDKKCSQIQREKRSQINLLYPGFFLKQEFDRPIISSGYLLA